MIELPTYGHPPNLAGATLEGLICEAFVYRTELQTSANVVFICARGVWWRASIDAGTIHWSEQQTEPQPWAVPEEGWSYPHTNVGHAAGLVGQTIRELHVGGEWPAVRMELRLVNGKCFVYSGVNDATAYSVY